MSVYVVDASVAAKWFLEEDYTTEAHRLLVPDNTLHVLALATLLGGKMVTADRKFFNALSTGPLVDAILWIEDVPSVA